MSEKEVKGGIGYVGKRLSRKELKVRLAYAKTPEERAVLISMMPLPPARKRPS